MGKAKRFNSYDSDVEQRRKLVKSYGQARQDKSVSPFRSIPQSPTTATNINNENVTTTVSNSSITFAKIQDIATMKVIGRTASGSGVSSEISILDEDTMSSNSATALATQQSIKAYVTSNTIANPIASALDLNGNQLQGITTAFFDGDIDNANSISGNTGGLDYNVDDTDEIHDFKVDGVSKFTVGNGQINMITNLSMSGNTIYLDSDVDSTIDSVTDDIINISTGGSIRLAISNTSTIATGNLSTLGNLQVDGNTILGDASSDTVAINGTLSTDIEMGGNDLDFATGGTIDFHDIDSSTHSSGGAPALPAQPTAYFVVKYQGGTRYIPYYS